MIFRKYKGRNILLDRYRGSEQVFLAVISCAIVSFMGLSVTKMWNTNFSALSFSNQRNQAMEYALNGADQARALPYVDLGTLAKAKIDGTDFYRERVVENSTTMADTKIATIKVYRNNTDAQPLASIKVTKSKVNDLLYDTTGKNEDGPMTQKAVTDAMRVVQRNKSYAVGDIAYSSVLPSWARLECVTAGTTGNDESVLAGVTTNGIYITDGSVRWIVDDVRDGTQVGEVKFMPCVPTGYVKCVGQTLSTTNYPRLLNFANKYNLKVSSQVTHPGGFVVNGTNITMPDYRGLFVRTVDDSKGYDASRALMSYQKGSIVPVSDDYGLGDFPIAEGPAHLYSSDNFGASDFPLRGFTWFCFDGLSQALKPSSLISSPGASNSMITGAEGGSYGYFNFYYAASAPAWFSMVRPRNVAMYAVMKY